MDIKRVDKLIAKYEDAMQETQDSLRHLEGSNGPRADLIRAEYKDSLDEIVTVLNALKFYRSRIDRFDQELKELDSKNEHRMVIPRGVEVKIRLNEDGKTFTLNAGLTGQE